jgi:hypothetical protein
MAESFVQMPADSTGKKLRTYDKGAPGHDQYVIPTSEKLISCRGYAASFRIPGRAGTTGQKIFAIHNATGSSKLVEVNKLSVDVAQTVVKAITSPAALIRVWRFTAVPTNGTACPKVLGDTTLTSNASVTCWMDASADGTSSASALTVTLPANNIITQEFAPRFITAVGYEETDRIHYFEEGSITLRALEGVCVFLDYTNALSNPTTDHWSVNCQWDEYTLP